jgi:very-short-patch-repair endonuclease
MQIKDFKDRSAKDRLPSEAQALAELLAARELREFPLTRQCEIGPFVVEYLFAERALVIELAPADARVKFLTGMGYDVVAVDPHELLRHPRRILSRLRSALKRGPHG